MRSTSFDVINSLPSDIQAFCPIELFQSSGCMKRLLQYIDTNFPGENFLKIGEGLAHLNFQEFCTMRNIYMANKNYDTKELMTFNKTLFSLS